MELLSFRLGMPADLDAAFSLLRRAVAEMDRRGIPQWDELYPTRQDLSDDIDAGQLYIGFCGDCPACIFVISEDADPEYQNGAWQYPNERFYILHRLCVDPRNQHGGVGAAALAQAELLAREMGYTAVRLDVFSLNPYALRLYEHNGFHRTGQANFRKGLFYLMEKKYC